MRCKPSAWPCSKFELEDVRFRAFTSKFDAHLDGKTTLSADEARGLATFEDPLKGNCSSCHTSVRGKDGTHPPFTNFTYHALGAPRNAELVANADPAHADLGLCAREGGDLAARADLCGFFKVPSLRNVALRRALFHNGRSRRYRMRLTSMPSETPGPISSTRRCPTAASIGTTTCRRSSRRM